MHNKIFFFIRNNLSSLAVLLLLFFWFWGFVLFCFLFFESFNFPAYPVFSASCWARKSVLRQLWLVFAVHTLVCVLAGWAEQMPLVHARQFSPVWASLLYAHFLFYPLFRWSDFGEDMGPRCLWRQEETDDAISETFFLARKWGLQDTCG